LGGGTKRALPNQPASARRIHPGFRPGPEPEDQASVPHGDGTKATKPLMIREKVRGPMAGRGRWGKAGEGGKTPPTPPKNRGKRGGEGRPHQHLTTGGARPFSGSSVGDWGPRAQFGGGRGGTPKNRPRMAQPGPVRSTGTFKDNKLGKGHPRPRFCKAGGARTWGKNGSGKLAHPGVCQFSLLGDGAPSRGATKSVKGAKTTWNQEKNTLPRSGSGPSEAERGGWGPSGGTKNTNSLCPLSERCRSDVDG